MQVTLPGEVEVKGGGPGRSVFAFANIVRLQDEDDPGPVRMAAVFTICEKNVKRMWRLYCEERPLVELLPALEIRAVSRIDPARGYLPLDIERLREMWK